jgi:hypothetical protein
MSVDARASLAVAARCSWRVVGRAVVGSAERAAEARGSRCAGEGGGGARRALACAWEGPTWAHNRERGTREGDARDRVHTPRCRVFLRVGEGYGHL